MAEGYTDPDQTFGDSASWPDIDAIQETTAHLDTEHALRQSEARYRTLAENAHDLVCELGDDGRFEYVSPNFHDILGYQPSELIGQAPFDLIHEEDRERVALQFLNLISPSGNGEPGNSQFRFARADGSWCWMEASANLFDAPDGGKHAVIVSRDITERHEIEQALVESEERLRTFVENVPVIMFAADRDGVFTLYEGRELARYGLSRGEHVGKRMADVHHNHPRIMANLGRALNGETFSDIVEIEGAHFDAQHAPIRDQHGNVTGMIGILVDVTPRIRAEEALRQSEERYRQGFANHSAPRYIVDPESGRIVEANQAACDFYGYSMEEMTDKLISEINTLELDDVNWEMRRDGEKGRTYFRSKHRLKSGAIRDVEINAAPIVFQGRTLLFSVVHDVTEQLLAQSLVAAQRHLMEMIAVGTPLDEVLLELVHVVEKEGTGTLCSIMLTSGDGSQLKLAAAPSLPLAVNQAAEVIPIGPDVGSCGTAAFRGETVVVTDIEHDPLWHEFKDIVLSHGLRACWSTPIVSASGSVLGTLAMYYREVRAPSEFEQEVVRIAAHVAGIAIERRRADQSLRSRTAELERMYKRLVRTHTDLEESKTRLEEKSRQLETSLNAERERGRRDQLTGALNHAAITDRLREIVETRQGISYAIAMVDVDGLKIANDTYGHQIGDAVLVKVAQTLGRAGATVGRYGGDEFVVIIEGSDRAHAERYRDEMLVALADAGMTDPMTGATIPVVASIGIAIFPDEAGTVEDLIRLSDSAMYQSRRHRPREANGSLARPLGGDRAAKMVGELVPLLTSPGNVQDKLRLVAHRLSVGAGYDAVNFVLSGDEHAGIASSSFARVPEDFLERWNRRQRSQPNIEIANLLERTKRPLILDDVERDGRVDDEERAMLEEAGLKSALVAPMIWENTLIGILTVASTRTGAFSVRDADFVAAVATQVTAIVRMSSLVERLRTSSEQLRHAHEGTVLMLASAAEAHDAATGQHLQRVRAISHALARELGYEDDAAQALGLAATLHDIGKIRVPDSVLGSAQSLAEAEWVLMKQHTIWGGAFLAGQPGFELASTVARYHHERWDGTGYPESLSGNAIPEAALITTVADSLDAMTSDRPYRGGRPLGEAVAEIVRCSGTQFSPRVVDALARLYERSELEFVEQGRVNGLGHHQHDAGDELAA